MAAGIWGKKFQCSECANNPSLRDSWGCKTKARIQQPTFEEREGGEWLRYWNCPILWLPESVKQFIVLYKYCKEFGGVKMPPPEDASSRFVLAAHYYNAKVAENMRLRERG